MTALSEFTGTDITVVDIGVDAVFNNPLIINKKIDMGTKNIAKGPAMTYEQAVSAIEAGIEIVDNLSTKGYDIFGTGEMGIGNTTTSAAVLCVLSGLSADLTAGKGAGLTEEQFQNKKRIIEKAIKLIEASAKLGILFITYRAESIIWKAKGHPEPSPSLM